MGLYTNIGDTRLTAGTIVAPDMMLDFLGDTWAALTTVFDMAIDEATGDFSDFTDLTTVYIGFPDEWDIDGSYDPQLVLRVNLWVNCFADGTPPPTWSSSFRLTTGGVTRTITGVGGNYLQLYRDYTVADGLPTGVTGLAIQGMTDADNYCGVKRDFGVRGPDCYYRFLIP